MEIEPNIKDSCTGKACVRIDIWDDEKLNNNPLAWEILYKCKDLLADFEFFINHKELLEPRIFYIPHEEYNQNPDLIANLESAFNQAYEVVMRKIIPAQKDAEILNLKNKIKKMIKEIENMQAKLQKFEEDNADLRDQLKNQDEIIGRYEECEEISKEDSDCLLGIISIFEPVDKRNEKR